MRNLHLTNLQSGGVSARKMERRNIKQKMAMFFVAAVSSLALAGCGRSPVMRIEVPEQKPATTIVNVPPQPAPIVIVINITNSTSSSDAGRDAGCRGATCNSDAGHETQDSGPTPDAGPRTRDGGADAGARDAGKTQDAGFDGGCRGTTCNNDAGQLLDAGTVLSLCGDLQEIDITDNRNIISNNMNILINDTLMLKYIGANIFSGNVLFSLINRIDKSVITEFEAERDKNYTITDGNTTLLVFAVCSINAVTDNNGGTSTSVTIATNREVEIDPQPPKEEETVIPGTGFLPPFGDVSAPIKFMHFGELQAPFDVRHILEVEPAIIDQYVNTGKVALYYRYFPFIFHDKGDEAALAMYCANEQNALWTMRTAIAASAETWVELSESGAIEYFVNPLGRSLSLNEDALRTCIIVRSYQNELNADTDEGNALNIQGVPTFFAILPKSRTNLDALVLAINQPAPGMSMGENGDSYIVTIQGALPIEMFAGIFDSVQ
ncbi:MAG: thioredoxin domain-containing protein [Candidatus Micrarchaeota archaeon]|nr:thioredoxin domain-containing protein [Candidatus Micrarchaeota archaeon]